MSFLKWKFVSRKFIRESVGVNIYGGVKERSSDKAGLWVSLKKASAGLIRSSGTGMTLHWSPHWDKGLVIHSPAQTMFECELPTRKVLSSCKVISLQLRASPREGFRDSFQSPKLLAVREMSVAVLKGDWAMQFSVHYRFLVINV